MAIGDLPASGRLAQPGWREMGLGAHLETTWAFICGLVASGGIEWLPGKSLHALTLWLAVDVVLGFSLQHWCRFRAWLHESGERQGDAQGPISIPYALPGSPGGRWAAWVNRSLAVFCSEQKRPWLIRDALAIILGILVAAVLATYVGPKMLGALGLGVVGWALMALLSRQPVPKRSASREGMSRGKVDLFPVRALALRVFLAWLMAHAILAPWQPHSVGLAALFAVLVYLRRRQRDGEQRAALWLSRAVWALALLALLIARQPIVAVVVASCALGSDLVLSGVWREASQDIARQSIWSGHLAWFVAAMITAAAATFWG
ncbi:MAG: hypothetical protein JXA74_13655 [Anaerolineae bacterium]|nr:hypothetical protein [Anaerolineae bacterium]